MRYPFLLLAVAVAMFGCLQTPSTPAEEKMNFKSHNDSVELIVEDTYSIGKPISFSVKANESFFVDPFQSWTVYKKEGKTWRRVFTENNPCMPSCGNCGPGLCAPRVSSCKQEKNWTWQQDELPVETQQCGTTLSSCIREIRPAGPGTYMIVFAYALSCPDWKFNAEKEIRRIEREFDLVT